MANSALNAAKAAKLLSKGTVSSYTAKVAEGIERCICAGLTVHLEGSPGTGKSSLIKMVAESLDLKVIDVRLSTKDTTDLSGLPDFVDVKNAAGEKIGRRMHFTPSTEFPLEGMDEIPVNPKTGQPYEGWLLFFDEISSATPSVQSAAYEVILDRMVGEYPLHERVAVVTAGNKESDQAVVFPMSTALRNRMVHIPYELKKDAWVEWARNNNIDSRLIAYVRWKPEHIEKFDPNNIQLNFASARTMEFTNRILEESGGVIDDVARMLIKGALGEGVGNEFMAFCNYYTEIPEIKDIVANPLTAPMPDQLGHQFALAGVIAQAMETSNCSALIQYAGRMDKEFQVVMAKDVATRKSTLLGHPDFLKWVNDNVDLFA